MRRAAMGFLLIFGACFEAIGIHNDDGLATYVLCVMAGFCLMGAALIGGRE